MLVRVERDRAFADLALDAELREARLSALDRALATELAYGTLRLRGRLDTVLGHVLDRDLSKLEARIRNVLRLGTYQLLFLQKIHDGAAVSESVELAKRVGLDRAAGLVNAVLRKVAQRAQSVRFPSLEDDPIGYLVQWGSIPEWLARRWVEELGPEEAAELADTCTRAAPRTVRVSEGSSLRGVHRRLGARRCRWAPRGLTELERNPLSDPAFYRGEFTVQDEGSQLVPLLLGVEPGATVVDCCAAPGAKAAQLAEQVGAKGEVIALDVNPSRLKLIAGTAKRLRLENLRILERDAAQGFDLRGQQLFDFVLVDAPCSGLGVLRRNADARWRLQPEDVPRAAERADAILRSAARYVRPGGALVYSVCTFSPEETTELTRRFLEETPEYRVGDPRPHLPEVARELVDDDGALRTWPHRHGCDAFYAVRLERQ